MRLRPGQLSKFRKNSETLKKRNNEMVKKHRNKEKQGRLDKIGSKSEDLSKGYHLSTPFMENNRSSIVNPTMEEDRHRFSSSSSDLLCESENTSINNSFISHVSTD